MSRVTVVTGSNKGIGFTVVKILATQNPDWIVYLTSRDVSRGEEALKSLNLPNVRFHQLDVLDNQSIANLHDHLKATHGGFDVLVNNAGIMLYEADKSYAEKAELLTRTNFEALLNVTHGLVMIMNKGGRIVNVGSRGANICYNGLSDAMKARVDAITSPEEVIGWTKKFVASAKAGKSEADGFGPLAGNPYVHGKLAVVLITPIMQKRMAAMGKGLCVNVCCPNFVSTDLNTNTGPKSVEFGADVIVYLATLPADSDISGKYLVERKVIDHKSKWKLDKEHGLIPA